jgi:hypothetical protein
MSNTYPLSSAPHRPHALWAAARLISVVALIMASQPDPARACGGFFCSQAQPVNQTAERIIFSDNPDGTITAVVQILYQGPSQSFAWVLPVPSAPIVEVSSTVAFDRLQSATNPQYTLTTTIEGNCRPNPPPPPSCYQGGGTSGAQDASTGGFDSSPPTPTVTVVDGGSVGPYVYELIQVDPSVADPAQVAVDWLTENGYDVTATGPDALRPYFDEQMMLLAFKLTKTAQAGDIRPVILTFKDDTPMIPIRPTAVAANDDMGVLTWILGEHRAVPTNYRSLVLNEAVIDWMNNASNYQQVINLAADEGGGQGFVTELASPSSPLAEVVFSKRDESAWQSMRSTDWSTRHGDLIIQAISTYSVFSQSTFSLVPWDGMSDVIRAHVPLPNGVTLQDLLSCPSCYFNRTNTIDGFDPAAFLAAIEAQVVQPMRRTQEILAARPYITRLYTTLSPREMTIDPVFDFNPNLADLSNFHQADRVIECSNTLTFDGAPWRATLPNGLILRGRGSQWTRIPGMPINAQIWRMTSDNEGDLFQDNALDILYLLNASNARYPHVPDNPNWTPPDTHYDSCPDYYNDTLDPWPDTEDGRSPTDPQDGAQGDLQRLPQPDSQSSDDACGCQSVRTPRRSDTPSAWLALALGAALSAGALRRRRSPTG